MSRVVAIVVLGVLIFIGNSAFAQKRKTIEREMRLKNKKEKAYPDFFGVQFRPIFPMQYFGAGPQDQSDMAGIHISSVYLKSGISMGGVVRIGVSKRFAIESGINFTRRNYNTDYRVPDSNFFAQTTLRNVSYDIPLNLLLYVQINEKLFVNASTGVSFLFFPTGIATTTQTYPHYYRTQTIGNDKGWVNFALNANTGMEYRTEKNGIFYLGASFHRPMSPIYYFQTEYNYTALSYKAQGLLTGIFFTMDVKYFFPNVKSKVSPKSGLTD